MTEVLHSPPSSSSPPSSPAPTTHHNPTLFHHQTQLYADGGDAAIFAMSDAEEEENGVRGESDNTDGRDQLSLLAILFTLFRKSFWAVCKTGAGDFSGGGGGGGGGGGKCGEGGMEISWPSDVQHVNHVTFDRFHGFLGLPVEFEPDVPRRAPSASTTVFGVSTESMQMCYDHRGNSIPTILLLMQRHLYSQGGLQAEGIFRIAAGNSQEEFVRDQLNRGVIPQGIDVHCLAGLIKAWFRELPSGVLDSLSPEQVMQCQSEEDSTALVRLLPPTESALLDWAINLMADVVQEEHLNKMNARNIAMVFAPNMTQMDDPLTALMYAVQVMNFLKTLVEKVLQEREDSVVGPTTLLPHTEPSDDNGNQTSSSRLDKDESNEEIIQDFLSDDPGSDTGLDTGSVTSQADEITDEDYPSYSTYTEESDGSGSCKTPRRVYKEVYSTKKTGVITNHQFIEENVRSKTGQSSDSDHTKSGLKIKDIDSQKSADLAVVKIDNKNKGAASNLSRVNSMTERFETWW
ncbi:hypothetical protein ACP275_14G245300 [Erythranthe tilingii]